MVRLGRGAWLAATAAGAVLGILLGRAVAGAFL